MAQFHHRGAGFPHRGAGLPTPVRGVATGVGVSHDRPAYGLRLRVQGWFNKMDTDGDGVITRAEFERAAQRQSP